MKYVVVCYAVHDSEIASHDWFDSYNDAVEFLKDDAQNTYDEEVSGSGADDVGIWIGDYSASVSSCDNGYKWTWEIIEGC